MSFCGLLTSTAITGVVDNTGGATRLKIEKKKSHIILREKVKVLLRLLFCSLVVAHYRDLVLFQFFIVLFDISILSDTVITSNGTGSWLLFFSLVYDICAVCCGLFALPLGIISSTMFCDCGTS